jgi:hypothetical protein
MWSVSSSRRRAVSSRVWSTYWPGVEPVSAVKARANWRGERLARPARVSTARAVSRSWSSSTRARARSMPLVTPAEVVTLPSRM